jgi:hypothetical protein
MHFLTAHCGRAAQKFETVVGERCFCGYGRGLTPRCLERFRALEEEDKLLIMLGGPLSPMGGPSCIPDPEVGNAAMALLAELWEARNEALSAKVAAQAPPPAKTDLFAFGFTVDRALPTPAVPRRPPNVAQSALQEPPSKASERAGTFVWGEFVPLAEEECAVRSVTELRELFRDEVRLSITPLHTPPSPTPTPTARLPAPSLPAGFAGLVQGWSHSPELSRSGLLSVGCRSVPPDGVEAHGAYGPTDFLSPAEP